MPTDPKGVVERGALQTGWKLLAHPSSKGEKFATEQLPEAWEQHGSLRTPIYLDSTRLNE
jgi:hypothetical protein